MNTPTRAPITPLPPPSSAMVAGEAQAPEAHAQAHPRAGIPQIGPIDKMMRNDAETGDPTEAAPAPPPASADARPRPIARALQALPTHRASGGTSRGPDAAPAALAAAFSSTREGSCFSNTAATIELCGTVPLVPVGTAPAEGHP